MKFNALINLGSPICFVTQHYIPQKYVIHDSGRDRYCGINGSGLKILGLIEATIVFDHKKYTIIFRVVADKTM